MAPIKKTTLSTLSARESVYLHDFLTNHSIVSEIHNISERPVCPVVCHKSQSAGRSDYKKAMMLYISGFGYEFMNENPCGYSPAFLEALANYCDTMAGIEKRVVLS